MAGPLRSAFSLLTGAASHKEAEPAHLPTRRQSGMSAPRAQVLKRRWITWGATGQSNYSLELSAKSYDGSHRDHGCGQDRRRAAPATRSVDAVDVCAAWNCPWYRGPRTSLPNDTLTIIVPVSSGSKMAQVGSSSRHQSAGAASACTNRAGSPASDGALRCAARRYRKRRPESCCARN